MSRRPAAAATLTAAVAWLFALTAAGAAHAEVTHDCRIAGIPTSVQCGSVERPLDPARPAGPMLSIQYVVVPAMARRKRPDPVFLIAGGPGQSAIDVAPGVMALFSRLNNRRDIVFVDQRGTGRSAPLACPDPQRAPLAEQADPERQFAQLMACQAALTRLPYLPQTSDLGFFTTPLAMQDLDAVRRQLGAPTIDLVGVSYGTRAALDYLRQFPGKARRAVLDAVAPPDMALPASFSTDGQTALDALFASCEAEAACARHYPRLRRDWQSLLASLPRPVEAVHPLTGATERFQLSRSMLLAAVRQPLYLPAMAAALPAAIDSAAKGRFEPLLGVGAMLSAGRTAAPAMGMHFSVVCAEDLPLMNTPSVGPRSPSPSPLPLPLPSPAAATGLAAPRMPANHSTDAPGADFGRSDADFYRRVCADWPRGKVPADFYRVPPSETPTLLLSGGLDPVTPPRHAAAVAAAVGSRARQLVLPNAGHGVIGVGCVRDIVFRFIDAESDGDAAAVDFGCAAGVPRPPAFLPIAAATEATPR